MTGKGNNVHVQVYIEYVQLEILITLLCLP